ncbi:MAG TPA: hypothetical protein VN833_00300 [Candidatus Acidoferrales bacterium]|jgi:hypothetical protein|nr:hypothetical protein [Candidatus Acidoferrales bacterium]
MSGYVLPESVGGLSFTVGIRSQYGQLMLRVRACIASLQELAFIRNAGWIDCVITEVETVKSGGYTRNSFFCFSFDPDYEIVSDEGALVLD